MSNIVRWLVLFTFVAGCKKEAPPAPAVEAASAPAPRERAPIVDAVNFASGSTAISDAEMAAVSQAAEILKKTDWKVIVVGLADSSGDADANKLLSAKRSEVVAAELRQRATGVDVNRISVHAIGEKLSTGVTQSERKVEFVFYHDKGLSPREIVIRSRVLEDDFRTKRESP